MNSMNIKRILFLDIETISCCSSFHSLDERLKPLWEKKARYLDKEADCAELFFEKAAIFAEFGKVLTISIGSFFQNASQELCFKVKSFYGDNEKEVLQSFADLLNRFDQRTLRLCAHNGKEFDFPYLCRRMLVNQVEIPEVLQIAGKKPWEVHHLDTLELWKFGDKKNYTSLELLAALFDVPSSKEDIDGSRVNDCYYHGRDLQKIVKYCEKDVIVTAQLYLRFKNLPLVPEGNVFFT